jgi:hypothetical protein
MVGWKNAPGDNGVYFTFDRKVGLLEACEVDGEKPDRVLRFAGVDPMFEDEFEFSGRTLWWGPLPVPPLPIAGS